MATRPDTPDDPVDPAAPAAPAASLSGHAGAAGDVADLLARAARAMHQADDLDATLDVVVQVLASALPHGLHVGIGLLRPRDGWTTHAATGGLVHDLDGLQHRLGEGPVVEALLLAPTSEGPGPSATVGPVPDDRVLVVPDLRAERRWAAYVAEARDRGVTAQAVARLAVRNRILGGISIYATGPDGLGPRGGASATGLLRLFATHAALAVDAARGVANLQAALSTRKTIGQAVGLVMERFGLDQERAFSYLVRLSSNRNVKLRQVAAELVAAADRSRLDS